MSRSLFIALALLTLSLNAKENREPVHEAFVTPITETVAFPAIDQEPPSPLTEKIPPQRDQETVWIPGYWHLDQNRNDFVWVAGVYRKPPPNHQWISGFWKLFDEGYVWMPGFWSEKEKDDIEYIGKAPPDQIDEQVPDQPSKEYFWSPGFWSYNNRTDDFDWISGSWEKLDPHWVLTPAHYTWREDGYVFIPAFWDWPLEGRGTAFASQWIKPGLRENGYFEPITILEPNVIVEYLFYDYPNYVCFYQHHYHFYPQFWDHYCCAPPWWNWDSWWCYPWHAQWGLWWWWGNPGFPQPVWLTNAMANRIPPPNQQLIQQFKNVVKPAIITPNGVVLPSQIRNAISKVTDNKLPIIPDNAKIRDSIDSLVKPDRVKEIFRPSGKETTNATLPELKKPLIPTPDLGRKRPLKPSLPSKPKIPELKLPGQQRPLLPPSIRPHIPERPRVPETVKPRSPIFKPRPRPNTPSPRRPHVQPRPNTRDTQEILPPGLQERRPRIRPRRTPQSEIPRTSPRFPGYTPPYPNYTPQRRGSPTMPVIPGDVESPEIRPTRPINPPTDYETIIYPHNFMPQSNPRNRGQRRLEFGPRSRRTRTIQPEFQPRNQQQNQRRDGRTTNPRDPNLDIFK